MSRSLRARLLVGTLLAVFAALVIVDAFTYTLVTHSQLDQIDQELERSHPPIERAASVDRNRIEAAVRSVAPASYVEVTAASGVRVAVVPLVRPGAEALVLPHLVIEPNPRRADDDGAVFATARTTANDTKLRVRVSQQDDGSVLVIGQPLDVVEHTRHQLLWVLGVGTAGALVTAAAIGAWLVRLGLAPLTAVEVAAAGITDSELDRRVPGANPATEVGRLAGAINTMLDRLHDGFQQRERDVEALQASEAKMRRFVADASHELRTPIAATAAYAELFERGARDRPQDLARAMAGIRSETSRMAELVDDLLLLAELDEGRPLERVRVELAEVAAEAVRAAHAMAPDRHVGLQIDDLASVTGDPSRLRQVLDNLLANVRAHTPPATPCSLRVTTDDDVAVLTVSDSGPGLDDATLARVTDRFFRADTSRSRSSGGSGLGLAIVSAIVDAHGGATVVDRAAGGGLRVSVRIPTSGPRSSVST